MAAKKKARGANAHKNPGVIAEYVKAFEKHGKAKRRFSGPGDRSVLFYAAKRAGVVVATSREGDFIVATVIKKGEKRPTPIREAKVKKERPNIEALIKKGARQKNAPPKIDLPRGIRIGGEVRITDDAFDGGKQSKTMSGKTGTLIYVDSRNRQGHVLVGEPGKRASVVCKIDGLRSAKATAAMRKRATVATKKKATRKVARRRAA